MVSFDLWQESWRQLGVTEADQSLYERLIACYSEPHRKYHTLQHLAECFTGLNELRILAERSAEIELALWFHDAIYETKGHGNEEQSANWAFEAVRSHGLAEESAARIRQLVLATKHNVAPQARDAEILVDVDLAILGATPARFDEYEQQVRDEYSWVPEAVFRVERRKILQAFLNRTMIYQTERFRTNREHQARENLTRSVMRLADE